MSEVRGGKHKVPLSWGIAQTAPTRVKGEMMQQVCGLVCTKSSAQHFPWCLE